MPAWFRDSRRHIGSGNEFGVDVDVENNFRSVRNRGNRYLIDRQLQKHETFTGITGLNTQDRAVQETERLARVARLERDAVELEGDAAIEDAGIRRLEHDISLRSVRAPVAGRVGTVAAFPSEVRFRSRVMPLEPGNCSVLTPTVCWSVTAWSAPTVCKSTTVALSGSAAVPLSW